MALPALSAAAREGNEEKLGQLLKLGHDCSLRDYAGVTPFQEAAENGHLQCLKLLVSAAGSSEYASSTKELLEIMCPTFTEDGDSLQKTPLYLAARRGHWQIVEFLVDFYLKATPYETGFALHAACKFKRHKCIKILAHRLPQLLNSVKSYQWDSESYLYLFPVHLSAQLGDLDGFNILVNAGVNIGVKGFDKSSVLQYACIGKNPDLVLQVLQSTNEINYVDGKGRTALYVAADREATDIVKLLLDFGADADVTPSPSCPQFFCFANCPLAVSILRGDFDTIKLLAPVTKKVDHQINAMVWAGRAGLYDVVCHLFKFGYPTFPPVFVGRDGSKSEPWNTILTANLKDDISSLITVFFDHGTCFPKCETIFSVVVLGRMHANMIKCFLDYGLIENVCSDDYSQIKRQAKLMSDVVIAAQNTQLSLQKYKRLLLNMDLTLKHFPFWEFSGETIIDSFSFPETISPVLPRLAELCRWNIRCCLLRGDKKISSKQVQALPLPESLRRFLLYVDK